MRYWLLELRSRISHLDFSMSVGPYHNFQSLVLHLRFKAYLVGLVILVVLESKSTNGWVLTLLFVY